jgi:single-strand DNA-binding protein
MSQKFQIIGHLGGDPVMRYLPNGTPVTSFNVASSKKWTNASGEKQEKTTWVRATAWRKTAELCAQYLAKGKLVRVEGEIEAKAWTDKNGELRASLELTVDEVEFLGGRGEQRDEVESETYAPDNGAGADEDLPF